MYCSRHSKERKVILLFYIALMAPKNARFWPFLAKILFESLPFPHISKSSVSVRHEVWSGIVLNIYDEKKMRNRFLWPLWHPKMADFGHFLA